MPFAVVLLMLAVRVYLGRFEQLFDDRGGAIFSGVAYTDANVRLTGMLVVAGALALGAGDGARQRGRRAQASMARSRRSCPPSSAFSPSASSRLYVNGFIVKPNELVRETPYITHNIEFTRKAYGLDRFEEQPFPAETGIEAVDPAEQPGDDPEHPFVGLARAAGHAAADSSDPHVLRIS